MQKTLTKDPRRQEIGRRNKAEGRLFEKRLDESFEYYRHNGAALIEKTPEPMHPTKSLGNGKFVAFFEKKAQPDYKGVIKGGREIMYEAKYTVKDRIEQDRVLPEQGEYMDKHQALGARCFVVVGFSTGSVYLVPWQIWRDMKHHFGRKYATEADLQQFRVAEAWNKTLLLLP